MNFGEFRQKANKNVIRPTQDVGWEDWPSIFSMDVDSLHFSSFPPTLFFIHLMLPHLPWKYLPSGETYRNLETYGNDGLKKHTWVDDEWAVAHGYQRHILQMGFVDKLLGDIIKRLKGLNLYDRSLFIVTADHGASFRANGLFRGPKPSNFFDIQLVPLLIKTPHQSQGGVSQRNVETIDIFPTVADILGTPIPWPVDGQSVFSTHGASRKKRAIYYKRGNQRIVPLINEVSLKTVTPSLKQRLAWFGPTNYPGWFYHMGPFREIIGQPVWKLKEGKNNNIIIQIDRTVFSSALITGRAFKKKGNLINRLHIAIAFGGLVQAVTRSYPLRENVERFFIFVPEKVLRENLVDPEFFLISKEGNNIGLHLVNSKLNPSYVLKTLNNTQMGLEILTSDGQIIPLGPNALSGQVSKIKIIGDKLVIDGWAGNLENNQLPDFILVFINGKSVFSGLTNRVVKNSVNNSLIKAGFRFDLPEKPFIKGADVKIFSVSQNGIASPLEWSQKVIKGLLREEEKEPRKLYH